MNEQLNEFSLRDLYRLVREALPVIIVLCIAGGIAGYVNARLTHRVYRAQALLSPVVPESGGRSTLSRLADQLAPVSGLLGGLGGTGGANGREVWIATLRSRKLSEQFITEKGLIKVLFADRLQRAASDPQAKVREPTMEEAFELFDRSVRSVTEDKRTGLLTLRIEWRDPVLAADWVNALVEMTNAYIRARAITDASANVAYLRAEAEKTNVLELQQVIYRLIETQISEGMMANVRKEYAFVVIDPAVAPSIGNFIRPRRMLLIAVGVLGGLLLGLIYASVRWARKVARTSNSPAPGPVS